MSLNRARVALLGAPCLLLGLASCNDRQFEDDATLDVTAPQLVIHSPKRGETLSGGSVLVSGQVIDNNGRARVAVAGQNAAVDESDSFESLIVLDGPGVHIIETHATDEAGNTSQDARGVLITPELSSTDIIPDALGIFLSPDAFIAISGVVQSFLSNGTVSQALVGMETIEVGGSCLGAELDFDSISFTNALSTVTAGQDVLDVHVSVDNLRVILDTEFQVACIGGTADVVATADRATIDGTLTLQLVGGKVRAEMVDEPDIGLDNFEIDVGNIPSSVTGLFDGLIEDRIVGFLQDQLREQIPAYIEGIFADLSGGKMFTLFEKEVFLQVVPTTLSVEPQGLTLIADAATFLDNFTAPHGLLSEAMPAVESRGSALDLFVAQELVNQFLATLAMSGALDYALPLVSGGRLGQLVDTLQLSWMLPPYIAPNKARESLELRVGDALANALKDGTSITQIAISALVDLEVGVEDGLARVQGESRQTWLDVLEENVAGANILNSDEIEVLASHSAHHAVRVFLETLDGTPFPVFAGIVIKSATVGFAHEGYFDLQGDLSVAESISP